MRDLRHLVELEKEGVLTLEVVSVLARHNLV